MWISFQVLTISLALALFTLRGQKLSSSKGNAKKWVLTTALVPNLLNQIIIGLPLYIAPFVACIYGSSSHDLHETFHMRETLLISWHDCKQGHINAMMCNVHLCMYHLCEGENLLTC